MKVHIRISTLLAFILGVSINLNAQLKVESNGNVRIGTNEPYPKGGKLQITGINETLEARIFVSSNNTARLWTANSTNAVGFGIDENAVGHIYRNINSPISIMTFNNNGYIGIGKNPSYTLDVNGSINANIVIFSSNESLRFNTKPIDNISDNLYNLNSISYKLHNSDNISIKNNENFHYGFIAQEVQNIFPELVYEDNNGILGIDYISFIPLLINELKQQQTNIENLRNEINILKSALIKQSVNKSEDNNLAEILYQNYPNPFNQATTINLNLPLNITSATLHIYDLYGNPTKTYTIEERGFTTITIDANELNTGIYIYSLIADQKIIDTKVFIITE
ncbi:MAG: tail fiber domain-containing protein [Bacteroidales bacterium]|nr:tail fiber domain-containing protein [Bacteroidales bacterium]